jgi:hypothetical protein
MSCPALLDAVAEADAACIHGRHTATAYFRLQLPHELEFDPGTLKSHSDRIFWRDRPNWCRATLPAQFVDVAVLDPDVVHMLRALRD